MLPVQGRLGAALLLLAGGKGKGEGQGGSSGGPAACCALLCLEPEQARPGRTGSQPAAGPGRPWGRPQPPGAARPPTCRYAMMAWPHSCPARIICSTASYLCLAGRGARGGRQGRHVRLLLAARHQQARRQRARQVSGAQRPSPRWPRRQAGDVAGPHLRCMSASLNMYSLVSICSECVGGWVGVGSEGGVVAGRRGLSGSRGHAAQDRGGAGTCGRAAGPGPGRAVQDPRAAVAQGGQAGRTWIWRGLASRSRQNTVPPNTCGAQGGATVPRARHQQDGWPRLPAAGSLRCCRPPPPFPRYPLRRRRHACKRAADGTAVAAPRVQPLHRTLVR